MTQTRTGAQILAQAVAELTQAGVPDAARDARRLLSHALGVAAGRLTLALPDPVSDEVIKAFEALIARRAKREPVSHLTGRRAFYGRDFKITSDVLDPRPETEMLIEASLSQPFDTLLDLGTGSGCILVTLLAETTGTRGVGVDLSHEALDVARGNAAAMGVSARTRIIRSHWFDEVEGTFDLIVANPPYIADYEMEDLTPDVREYEPRMALTDEADGLEAYRAIFGAAAGFLEREGRLIVEIGHTQAEDVTHIAVEAGFAPIAVLQDLNKKDRVIVSVLPEMPF